MAKKTKTTAEEREEGRGIALGLAVLGALAVVIGFAIYFTHSTINTWWDDTYGAVKTAIDWGFIFIALALLTLIFLIWRGKFLSLFRNWNKWLGAIALTFAAWGILAFVGSEPGLGGTFGLGIIGARDFPGVLQNLRPGSAQRLLYRAHL